MSVFSVEIMRPGRFGLNTSATLEMPATWAEYQDAKEKARITDDHIMYSSELLDCKYDWLRPHTPENGNLLELNLLAQRMEQYIKGDLDIFEAMVKIEAGRSNGEPIPLPRLINLTFSTENCHVAGNVANDTQLGKFLYDNEFLSDGTAAAVRERIESGRPASDLLALLGKEHRADTGGVFTATGRYVEFDGSVNEIYVPGEMGYFERSGAPVVLKLFKDNKTAALNLPETYSKNHALIKETLGVRNFESCSSGTPTSLRQEIWR